MHASRFPTRRRLRKHPAHICTVLFLLLLCVHLSLAARQEHTHVSTPAAGPHVRLAQGEPSPGVAFMLPTHQRHRGDGRAAVQLLADSDATSSTTTTTTEEPTTTTTTTTEEPSTTTTTTEEPTTTTTTTTEEPTTTTTTEEPSITTTTEEPTTTTTTSTSTTTTSTTTTTTTTAEPTTTTTTTTSTTTAAPAHVSKSKWWIALAVVLPLLAVSAVALLVWCWCTGGLLFASCSPHRSRSDYAPVDDQGEEGNGTEKEMASAAFDRSSGSVPKCTTRGGGAVLNPLQVALANSPTRVVPRVAGDPQHINRCSNRPFQVNGVVPWTGRPPVLHGPQPPCMMPTITPEGKLIPMEERAFPGLGLYETPRVYLESPAPLQKKRTTSSVARQMKGFVAAKVLRRWPRRSTAASPVPTATEEEAPRMQWFHQLVYFTAVDVSPAVSGLDESDGDEPCPPTEAKPQPASVPPVTPLPPADGTDTAAVQSAQTRAPRPTPPTGSRPASNTPVAAGAQPPSAEQRQRQLSAKRLEDARDAEGEVTQLCSPMQHRYSWDADEDRE